MEAEGILELPHERSRELANSSADPFDRHGADLLRLRLGVATRPTFDGRKKHLKWVEPGHVGGHRHDCDDAAVEPGCRCIGRMVLEDLQVPPGNRLERLKGDQKGQRSIRINQQYRVCFKWTERGPEDVEVIDYHR